MLLRDAKARAKRIDLTYFKRSHPFRRGLFLLSVAVPVLAAAWITFAAVRRDERIYNSGGIAPRHAMLENNCKACHSTSWAQRYTDPAGWQEGLDAACLACHDGPVHHANATGLLRGPKGKETSARCSECHVEHESRARLADVSDRHCLSCHADLKTTGPEPHPASCPAGAHPYPPKIESFGRGHPEFALLAAKKPDPSVSKFNHAVHLKPDAAAKVELIRKQLQGLAGRRGVETLPDGSLGLGCVYCHAPEPSGAYMTPVHYESHCADCHPIKFKDERVPHRSPDVVRDFLRSRLSKGVTGDALEAEVAGAEAPLYDSDPDGCMKCHKTDMGDAFPEKPPVVARTGLRPGPAGREGTPRRWFTHSVFNHETHRELKCAECHAAGASKLTSDLLMPSRDLCLKCHTPQAGVSSTCVTCHRYHDRTRERKEEGRLKVGDVVK